MKIRTLIHWMYGIPSCVGIQTVILNLFRYIYKGIFIKYVQNYEKKTKKKQGIL